MRSWPLLTQQATTIDRDRLDQFKTELLTLCQKYDLELTRFYAQEDHNTELPSIRVDFLQFPVKEEEE